MELRIAGKFVLKQKIGEGSFGAVYRGLNALTGEDVAIKLEKINSRSPQLLYEAKLYKLLSGRAGIPVVHWYGIEGDFNVMVMDLLGDNLQEWLVRCGGTLTIKSVLMLADQMISIIEHIHSKNLIHRDIKPENFTVGLGRYENRLHIIDFGLAKKFRDSMTFQHIPFKENKSFVGTARYASIDAHMGIEQSRRDDMEAIGHVLVYLCKGRLPWQGIVAGSKREKFQKIGEMKTSTSLGTLCDGLPQVFASYFESCRSLSFEQKPDYAQLRRQFKYALTQQGHQHDFVFDWMLLPTLDLPKADSDSSESSIRIAEEALPLAPIVVA